MTIRLTTCRYDDLDCSQCMAHWYAEFILWSAYLATKARTPRAKKGAQAAINEALGNMTGWASR